MADQGQELWRIPAGILLRRPLRLLLVLVVGWFLFQLFGPDPRIEISPATTYIVEPLADDGLPD